MRVAAHDSARALLLLDRCLTGSPRSHRVRLPMIFSLLREDLGQLLQATLPLQSF